MPVCPACHADLKGSPALTKGNRPACPFCGVELHLTEVDGELPDSPADEDASRGDGAVAGPPLPPKSRLEVVDHSAERLVVHIPPGGDGAKGLGCMVLAWNGFMCLFTPPWFFAMGQGQGPPLLFIVPFLLLFWCVGLGLAWFWVRLKHTRTYLLIEPERIVLQKQRFQRKWLEEGRLTAHSSASLVESYSVNNVPVHAIHVPVEGRTFKFGTNLSEPEKHWLAEAINRQLGKLQPVSVIAPKFCSSCGEKLTPAGLAEGASSALPHICPQCGAAVPSALVAGVGGPARLDVPRALPADVPPDSPVRIESDDGERLRFSVPLIPVGKFRTIASVILGLAGGVWLIIAVVQLGQEFAQGPGQNPAPFWIAELAFTALFGLPAAALCGVAGFIRRARITTDVGPDWLRVRYHWGPLGMTRRLESTAIDSVQLESEVVLNASQSPHAKPPPTDAGHLLATVHSGATVVPLTMLHESDIARLVAGLVQTRLEALGVRTGA